jgi:hypothetical protein
MGSLQSGNLSYRGISEIGYYCTQRLTYPNGFGPVQNLLYSADVASIIGICLESLCCQLGKFFRHGNIELHVDKYIRGYPFFGEGSLPYRRPKGRKRFSLA